MANNLTPEKNGKHGWIKNPIFLVVIPQLILFFVWLAGYLISHGKREEQQTDFIKWRSQVDAKVARMDEQGTTRSHYVVDELTKQITRNEERISRIEKDTAHLDVIEVEHQRLTKDVEKLKNGKK